MINIKNTPLYRSEYNLEDKISKLDLGFAEELNSSIEHSSQKMYSASGLEYIINIILDKLRANGIKESVNNIFIESSLFPSSIERNRLAAFICLWNKNKSDDIKFHVQENFSKIIDKLQKSNLALLWHPDFAYESDKPMALESRINDFSDIDYEGINFYAEYSKLETELENSTILKDVATNQGELFVTNARLDFKYEDFKSQSRMANYRKERSIRDLHQLNHLVYHKEFLNKKNQSSYFLSIPIMGASSSEFSDGEELVINNKFKGQGAIFIFLVFDKSVEKELVSKTLSKLSQLLPRIIKEATPDYLFNIGLNLLSKAKKQAINAAKAAIMGRNMSHNIGSHVLYYLKGHLSSVTKMMRDQIVLSEISYNILENEKTEYLEIKKQRKKLNAVELPFLKGIGRFLTYLQERQDFIATIASSYHPSMVSVNFKDFIIDNFLPDKRAERHNSDLKKERNILLKYLAKSEGIDVDIYLNGRSLASKNSFNKELRDIEIDVPGGVLGRQAFYSILENIIRNAAKHGTTRAGENLILDIEISLSADEQYYSIQITDNNINSGSHAQLVDKMLDEDIIDNRLRLIEHHKGIKEIKISALWLLGISLNTVRNGNRKKFIEVKNKNGQMSFEFRLFKSRKLAYVCNAQDIPKLIAKVHGTEIYSFEEAINNITLLKRFSIVAVFESRSTNATLKAKWEQLSKKLKRVVIYDNLPNDDGDLKYSNIFLQFIKRQYQEIRITTPFICTSTLESSNGNQKLEIENDEIKKWIETDGIHFVASPDTSPIIYNQSRTNSKNIAFRRHFKELKELSIFFGKDFRPESYNTFASKKLHVSGFIEEAQKNYYSIESITGDNSSTRILFNEVKNDDWVLRCTETALSRVLILDERLWNNSRFYTPTTKNKISEKVKKAIERQKYDQKIYSFNRESFFNEIEIKEKKNKSTFDKIESVLNKFDINQIVNGSNPELYKDFSLAIEESFTNEVNEKYNIYAPTCYRLNGIEICNVKSRNENSIEFVDLFGDKFLKINNVDDVNNLSVKLYDNSANHHYLSIHQGILDKVFNLYYQKNQTNKLECMQKEDFIPILIKALKNCIIPFKMSIHSGRSKPYVLPDGIAFIPFSGLEYGMNESKQVLLNILLSAESN